MFKRLLSPVELEEEVLDFWERERIFERSLQQSAGRPSWVFYEGPPTANGTPHNGHVLTRVIKDIFPRYKTMQGYHVERRAGWDTHGLPVEVEVEKKLGLKGREAIAAYGLEPFSRECLSSVFSYVSEWERLTKHIGFWVDLDSAYVTYRKSYVESVWWALSELFRKDLLYKGHKVVWWWPQGGTALSAGEVGQGYKEVSDPAITVRFRDVDDPRVAYLAWTTTPWTLISNVALAVDEEVDYAYCDDPDGEGEVVLAASLAEGFGLRPRRVVKGRELLGRRYTPLYDFGAPEVPGKMFVLVHGAHVTTDAGTGIVHTAPAFGEEDMEVAKAEGLGLLQWIDPHGRFTENCGWLAGRFCKEADPDIIAELAERGVLFHKARVKHDYPFCWRAMSDPLIQYARPGWFIRTTRLAEQAIENNRAVRWLPEHIQEGRFGDFLRNNVDWALSRERFWGTPLNIWICEDEACGHAISPSSVAEMLRLNPHAFDHAEGVEEDLLVHRPWIDAVTFTCPECGQTMRRVPEVIDCWFDSGCMPFAQQGFPHKGVEAFKANFPADFISEAVDQTRGWFYSLLMISTLLFDDETCEHYGLDPVGFPRPYRSCLVLGHVGDAEGRKESKSKGNYTSPNLVLRGRTPIQVLPDASLGRDEVGFMSTQLRSMDLPKGGKVSLSCEECEVGPELTPVRAEVTTKESIHVHPEVIAEMGLPAEGGRVWMSVPGQPPGADAFRWLFAASSPPWNNTRLSLRAIREGQREFLMRLRNVYQFFSIYADIAVENGSFDPAGQAHRPPAERAELDRWILHQLHTTLGEVTTHLDAYRLYEASRALLAFVDDLSNWYVRRSRSRFWAEGTELLDALWTLYEVLTTLARMIAPFVPFTAEALYQGLQGEQLSVHLDTWPQVDASLLDPELAADMALIRKLASLGLAARQAARLKVRQPLEAATVVLADPERQGAVERLSAVLESELNVHRIHFAADASAFVEYRIKPDFRKLGPKLGRDVKAVAGLLARADGAQVKAALDAGGWEADLGDRRVTLTSDEVLVTVSPRGDFESASDPEAVVAISTLLTDALRAEGLVRELTNRIQGLRKELDLGYTQRIALTLDGAEPVRAALAEYGEHLVRETLTRELSIADIDSEMEGEHREWEVEGLPVRAVVLPL